MERFLKVWMVMIVVGFAANALVSCAAMKPIARTLNDAGTILCELFAVDQNAEFREGLSPGQWCAVKEHVQPFVDEALAAKQAAAQRVSNPSSSE